MDAFRNYLKSSQKGICTVYQTDTGVNIDTFMLSLVREASMKFRDQNDILFIQLGGAARIDASLENSSQIDFIYVKNFTTVEKIIGLIKCCDHKCVFINNLNRVRPKDEIQDSILQPIVFSHLPKVTQEYTHEKRQNISVLGTQKRHEQEL